jgi:hypothetical protein
MAYYLCSKLARLAPNCCARAKHVSPGTTVCTPSSWRFSSSGSRLARSLIDCPIWRFAQLLIKNVNCESKLWRIAYYLCSRLARLAPNCWARAKQVSPGTTVCTPSSWRFSSSDSRLARSLIDWPIWRFAQLLIKNVSCERTLRRLLITYYLCSRLARLAPNCWARAKQVSPCTTTCTPSSWRASKVERAIGTGAVETVRS